MQNQWEANNKLLLLYLVDKLPGQTESDLMGLAIKTLYFDFFTYKQHLEQLLSQNLVYCAYKKDDPRKDAKGRAEERVYLTEQGQNILTELRENIPYPMRNTVDALSQNSKEEIENKDSIIAQYSLASDGFYHLELQLMNGTDCRFRTTLMLADEVSCKKMAKNWKTNPYAIYQEFLRILQAD